MNDKLKELMLEAGYAAPEIAGRGQLLAELIVQECVKLVEDNIDPQNDWITPAFIKQHFGVDK